MKQVFSLILDAVSSCSGRHTGGGMQGRVSGSEVSILSGLCSKHIDPPPNLPASVTGDVVEFPGSCQLLVQFCCPACKLPVCQEKGEAQVLSTNQW